MTVIDLAVHRERRASTAQPTPELPWQRAVAQWCLRWSWSRPDIIRLNDRERDFLENMLQWGGLPTQRQAAWLEQIERRIIATLNDQLPGDGAA
jgi:hypothetical protein